MDKNSKLDKFLESTAFKVFCAVDSALGIVMAFLTESHIIFRGLCIISIFLLIVAVFFLAYRHKKKVNLISDEYETLENKYGTLKNEYEILRSKEENRVLLEKNIHNGLKYTRNKATITLNKDKNVYQFEFVKEFEIISDVTPKWYSAQFYANKILKNKNDSKQYYQQNTVKWKDLNVKAQISYMRPSSQKFTDYKKLEIYNVADDNNYIPFLIQYIEKNKNRALDLKKGTKVKLKYSYDVPVDLWGSYLNRSVSYFEEEMIVKLRCELDTDLDIKVSKLTGSLGTPTETNDYVLEQYDEDQHHVYRIKLKANSFVKYRIWWDSSKYFSQEVATEDTADNSQLTNY